jgi:hypothetical protein
MKNNLLPLGTKIKPYGILHAYLWTGGERYYMFKNKRKDRIIDVALLPASLFTYLVVEGG